tara:strand:- start:95 stop:550 length:456 start_codon:yes stop_codon:yes gene_type:complete
MELKKIIITVILIFIFNISNAEIIKPAENLSAYDVVKIQLEALKKNNKKNDGIKQTWLFAHPDNKKFTGPYERFENMMFGQQYKFLLNHSSHKIKLLSNSSNSFIYRVEIIADNKKLFLYEWHVQRGKDKDCDDCWFTSAVSQPFDQGNTI